MTQQQRVKAPRGQGNGTWVVMTIKPETEWLNSQPHITDVDKFGNPLMTRPKNNNDSNFVAEPQWAIHTFYEWDASHLAYPTDKHYINKSVMTPKPGNYNVYVTQGNVKDNKGGTYDNDYHYNIIEWEGLESPSGDQSTTNEVPPTQEGTPDPQRNVSPPSNVERRDETPPPPRMDPTQARITYLSCQHDASEIMASAMEEILIACRPSDNLDGSERVEAFMGNFERDALPYIARLIPLLTDSLVDSVKSKNLLP